MKKQKRIGSPKSLHVGGVALFVDVPWVALTTENHVGALQKKEVKQLHAWLGKAIQYLEQERK